LGKSRSHIANLLRLLNLPQDIQDLVEEGKLSSGHARALITSDHAQVIAKRIVNEGLSVRATEALVKKYASGDLDKPKKAKPAKDADTKALEGDLSANLGMSVQIDHKAGSESGQVIIKYKDMEQLDELCRILTSQ
jgi:ParB family chromosome partitioning protein